MSERSAATPRAPHYDVVAVIGFSGSGFGGARPREGRRMMWLLCSRACAASGMTSCKRQPRVVIALLQLSSRLSSLPTNSAACGLRYTSLKWVDIPAIPPCEMGCHRDRGKSCDWPRVQVEGIGVTMWGAATKRSTRAKPCGAGAIRRVIGEADLNLPRRRDPDEPRKRDKKNKKPSRKDTT